MQLTKQMHSECPMLQSEAAQHWAAGDL